MEEQYHLLKFPIVDFSDALLLLVYAFHISHLLHGYHIDLSRYLARSLAL
jgi:hypothetical protein